MTPLQRIMSSIRLFVWMGLFFTATYIAITALGVIAEIVMFL